jgi:hypothetical protein
MASSTLGHEELYVKHLSFLQPGDDQSQHLFCLVAWGGASSSFDLTVTSGMATWRCEGKLLVLVFKGSRNLYGDRWHILPCAELLIALHTTI